MVLSPAWNRGQEREADLLGIDLLVKAGYSPAAVDEVMAILVEAEADPDRVTLDRVVTDLKSMEWLKPDSAAATDAATKGDTGMPNLGIFGGAGKMASGWVGGVMKGVQADHPRAEERRVDTSKYVAREYTAVATQVEDPKPLLAAKQQSYTKQLLKSYDQAYSALQAAEKGNMKLAEKLAFASTNGAMSNHSYPRFYFSRVREQEGDLRRALQSLELAYDSPEPALRIYQRAGEFYERLGDQAGAIRILETAERKFGKPPALMPDLIALYQRAGRTGDADRLTLECVTKHPEMAELCGGQKQAGAGENIRTGLLDR